eukprot:gnl/MRDRNA2_/MRDRNA2_101349_c0_seq1.p1 gnl/MRDRNA2_/MRDRNA2_101349_c0~~gnl/MRDRNA2_/MRDRNA2_101349_c0_seq1.p1  ORF type:complete len:673 (-),score=124.74 gnl/MRDRNA2_/MRDRNA2_101349_c0_seq1:99-2018(-)
MEATETNVDAMKIECKDLRAVAVTTAGRIKTVVPPQKDWLPNLLPDFGTWVRSIPDFQPDEMIQVKLNADREVWKKGIILMKREEDGLYNIKVGEKICEKVPKERIKPQDMTIPPSVLRFSWMSVEEMFTKGYWLGVSGSADGSVKIWNFRSQECIGTCVGHDGPVHTLDCDFLRRRALSGGGDGVLRIWDIENCEQIFALFGHSRAVLSARADFFRLKAVSSSADGTVKMWDLKDKVCLHTLEGHEERIPVCRVDFVRQAALTCSWDGTLRLWDLKRRYCRQLLKGHTDRVYALAADFKIGRAVSASEDGNMIIWDFTLDFKDIQKRPRTADLESEVSLNSRGEPKTPESEDFQGDQASVSDEEEEYAGADLDMLLENNPEAGAGGEKDPENAENGELRPETPSEKPSEYYHIPQTPCARVLSTLTGHKDAVTTICVDFVRGRVLSGSADETLRIWQIPIGTEGKGQREDFLEEAFSEGEGEAEKKPVKKKSPICNCLATLRGHSLPVTVVRADFRRNIAVSGSDDMDVRVWDLDKRACKSVLQGHTGYVLSLASDFPRFRVVTTSADYTIRLWSVEHMQSDGNPMFGHVQKVTCIFTNTLTDDLDEEEREKEKERKKKMAAPATGVKDQGIPQPQES